MTLCLLTRTRTCAVHVLTMSSQLIAGSFKYYVAIDFGTHGTGFSYSAKPDGDCSPRMFE